MSTTVRILAAKKVQIEKPFIDYGKLSEGQLNTFLMARNAELKGTYENNENVVLMSKEIQRKIVEEENFDNFKIAGFNNSWIESQKQKFWPSHSGYYFQKNTLGNPVSFEDWKESELDVCAEILNQWRNTSWLRFSERKRLRDKYNDCTDKVNYISNLNDNLEGAAYQPLYNFIGNSNAPTTVIVKSVLHKNFASSIAQVTGLSYESISLWLRNGILAQNMSDGIGDLSPEDSINVMRVQVPNSLGEPITGTVALLGLIIKAIAAAIPLVLSLINAFRDNDKARILAASESVGTATWGAQESDWVIGQQSQNDLINLIPLILGGYLVYKSI